MKANAGGCLLALLLLLLLLLLLFDEVVLFHEESMKCISSLSNDDNDKPAHFQNLLLDLQLEHLLDAHYDMCFQIYTGREDRTDRWPILLLVAFLKRIHAILTMNKMRLRFKEADANDSFGHSSTSFPRSHQPPELSDRTSVWPSTTMSPLPCSKRHWKNTPPTSSSMTLCGSTARSGT